MSLLTVQSAKWSTKHYFSGGMISMVPSVIFVGRFGAIGSSVG